MDAVIDEGIPLAEVLAQAGRVQAVVSQVRGAMLAPENRKTPPRFYTGDVMNLTGLDKNAMDVAVRKRVLPVGKLGAGNRREFTLEELQSWVRHYRAGALRPAGAHAVTIAVANFKGGVTKTTTALTLAQGLSLRGHRVLVIDTDPQGSLTTLFGILPDTEVRRDDTMLPLVEGAQDSLRYAVRPTYWSGIDLVAAAPLLFGAEFELSGRMVMDAGFQYWRVLELGLQELRTDYDVIIMDTPPALSYMTINVLMAADGILMPLPPNALDFASSAQFWQLFGDLTARLPAAQDKRFDFISILPTRVETTDAAGSTVREWMAAAYAEKLLPVEIPKSAAAGAASANFGTVYDEAVGTSRTVRRATDAADRLADAIGMHCIKAWRRQLARGAAA
ncbi:AAA family ATPase [uncultured Azohydromonas sp.]|jgi:ATPases involved in chromosome partitioning|uniref:AAA family ATPase n=1 Tax=uncultured Azohydromonas sp. TaxID=487342 RepID=UPI0026268E65|nr:AAA family ATPase [uncultured Azohydromonas sp.]